MSLGQWMKKVREEKKPPNGKAWLTRELRMGQNTVARWEEGLNTPNENNMRAWALVVGVSEDEAVARLNGTWKDAPPRERVATHESAIIAAMRVMLSSKNVDPTGWMALLPDWLARQTPEFRNFIIESVAQMPPPGKPVEISLQERLDRSREAHDEGRRLAQQKPRDAKSA